MPKLHYSNVCCWQMLKGNSFREARRFSPKRPAERLHVKEYGLSFSCIHMLVWVTYAYKLHINHTWNSVTAFMNVSASCGWLEQECSSESVQWSVLVFQTDIGLHMAIHIIQHLLCSFLNPRRLWIMNDGFRDSYFTEPRSFNSQHDHLVWSTCCYTHNSGTMTLMRVLFIDDLQLSHWCSTDLSTLLEFSSFLNCSYRLCVVYFPNCSSKKWKSRKLDRLDQRVEKMVYSRI